MSAQTTSDRGNPRRPQDQSGRWDALRASYPGSQRCPSTWRSAVPWHVPSWVGAGLRGLWGKNLAQGFRAPPPREGPTGLARENQENPTSQVGLGSTLGLIPRVRSGHYSGDELPAQGPGGAKNNEVPDCTLLLALKKTEVLSMFCSQAANQGNLSTVVHQTVLAICPLPARAKP